MHLISNSKAETKYEQVVKVSQQQQPQWNGNDGMSKVDSAAAAVVARSLIDKPLNPEKIATLKL